MTEIFTLFTNDLADENDIDSDTAAKIVAWLVTEGVLDNTILTETYAPVTGAYSSNDNTLALTAVA